MKKFFATLCLLTLALAGAASAFAEATPYASIRVSTTYIDVDNQGVTPDTTDLEWTAQTNTRLGVSFKASDVVSGKFEVGVGTGAIGLRLAYGVWDFGPGTLTIGQDYAPFDWGAPQTSNQDDDLAPYALSIARSPQVAVRFDQGVYVGLIKNPNNSVSADDVDFPVLAVGYDGKVGSTAFGVGAGYATYEKTAGNDADTWFVYGQVEQGLGMVTLLAKLYYGQNLNEIGAANSTAVAVGSSDATTIGGFIAAVGSFTDKVGFQTGIGYLTTDTDIAGQQDDDQFTIYFDLPVQIAKGFKVVPNVAWVDGGDAATGGNDADTLYVGAKWQFDL